jgi:plasmid maintenance system antidote protein VapI
MERVKQMVEAGVRVGTAIREALSECKPEPLTVARLAAKHELPRTSTHEAFNGLRTPTDAQILALVTELGGTEDEWRALLKEARIRAAMAA